MSEKPRTLLVVLLIAAILICGGCIWVLTADRSPDACLARGSAAMKAKNYAAAARYLSAAVERGADDPEAVCDLSAAYRQLKNYTKAEYCLVRAMSRHADDARLYIALCRTYVEQGKFLDAAQLLDRIANDAVKAELDAMRPAAPHLEPEGGYYSDFITVSASCPAGHLYVSADGDYPTSLAMVYDAPIALERGENVISAIVADDQGLVSPLTQATYVVSGIVEPITLRDAALDVLARSVLGKTADVTLLSSDLWTVEELTVPEDVRDLSQLGNFIGLRKLTVSGKVPTDLSFLPSLTKLEELTLSGRTLSSGDLQQISLVSSLKKLDLSDCAVRDVSVLAQLTGLEELNLSDNIVENLDALASMQHLKTVNLHNNPVTSLSAMRGCLELETLDVSSCRLTVLNALADRPALKTLNASANRLSSVEALRGCTGLVTLDLSQNELTDVSPLDGKDALEVLNVSYNKLTALPRFDFRTAMLRSVDLSHNAVSDLSPLYNLMYLNYIYADSNKISDLTPVAECYNLVEVNLWDNPVNVETAELLKSHSILVRYEPT